MQQARQALHGLADQAGEAMTRAAEELAIRKLPSAVASQTEVLPPLNQLFEFVAPFEAILQQAISNETVLVETSNQALEEGASSSSGVGTTPESEEAAETQRFVSGWARMLIRKAEQLLSEAAASSSPGEADAYDSSPTEIPLPTSTARPAANSPSDTPPSDVAPNDAPRSDVPPSDAPPSDVPPSDVPPSDVPTENRSADASATTDTDANTDAVVPPADPQAAYEKAVELGPRIVTLTREAADDLLRKSWTDALPKQEESLKLLKEIAALLPPQEPPDDQEQQDQDKQDDQKQQDKKEQDQDGQDKDEQDEKKNQSSDDEKKEQEDDQSESKQQDDQKKQVSDEEKSKQENAQKQQQKELSRQQAESLLRQVRERDREQREFEKEIRRLLRSRIIVERDW